MGSGAWAAAPDSSTIRIEAGLVDPNPKGSDELEQRPLVGRKTSARASSSTSGASLRFSARMSASRTARRDPNRRWIWSSVAEGTQDGDVGEGEAAVFDAGKDGARRRP